VIDVFCRFLYVQVIREHGQLRSVPQGDTSFRDGHAGKEQRLPPGVFRLPAMQSQVTNYLPFLIKH
jgi:hypothetical protein